MSNVQTKSRIAQALSFNFSMGVKSWLILILLSFIWGSSFILIKKSLVAFSPVQVACLRISISAIAFLPFFLGRLRQIDWSKLRYYIIVGLAGSGFPAFLFAFAQTQINSVMAGILNSLTPLFTLVLGMMLFGSQLIWSKVLGVLVGLVGAALLILLGHEQGIEGKFLYSFLVILATICYATSVNTVGTYLKKVDSITLSAVTFCLIGLPALIYLLSTDFLAVMQSGAAAWTSLGYVSILALMGTVIASVVFFYLVHMTNALFASMIAYLIPIVAFLWGLADGEHIQWFHFAGMALILSGIYVSRK